MPRPQPLPPLGPAFSVDAARSAGVSRSRLRHARLDRPFHGVRSLLPAQTLEDRCRSYRTVMAPHAAFSHSTAAALHGLPLPVSVLGERELHVSTARRAPRAEGIQGHQLPLRADELVLLSGLRVTSPERTFCDLASDARLGLGDLIAVADHVLRRDLERGGDALAAAERLRSAVANHRSRRGRPRLRHALALADARAESAQESRLRVLLVESGLGAPELQHEVTDARGHVVARLDLAFPAHRLAIEYEGDHHRTENHQWRRDVQRTRDLEYFGWRVVRVTAADLVAPASLLRTLRLWLSFPPMAER